MERVFSLQSTRSHDRRSWRYAPLPRRTVKYRCGRPRERLQPKTGVLNDPEGADPIVAEGAPHAVRAGNLVFCSGFTASDFKNGLAVGKRPGFPNYGSDAEMQAEYVFTRMNRVLKQAGTSLEQAIESQLYEPNLLTFHDVDGIWSR